MKHMLKWTVVLPLLVLGYQSPAQDVSKELRAIARYEPGSSREAISAYESRARAASAEQLAAIENEMVWLLRADDATLAGRQFACRMLRRVGTARSVPALGSLLRDEKLSHMARFALQGMPDDAAGAALRSALADVEGDLLAGILHSLGERRDKAAVAEVGPKLSGLSGNARIAALEMLGKVGSKPSAEILVAELDGAMGAGSDETDLLRDAVLCCAAGLAADGETSAAEGLYRKLFSGDHPRHVRIAGFRGMVRVDPAGTATEVVKMLADDDPVWRGTAARLIVEVPGSEATLAWAALLHRPPDDARVRLIQGLAERGDPAALPAISEQVISALRDVHVGAVKALGTLGDASTVPLLTRLAVDGSAEARRSLVVLRGQGVNDAMAELMSKGDGSTRIEMARALGARRARAQAPALLVVLARSDDPAVRTAVFSALEVVAASEHLTTMVQHLAKATDRDEIGAGIAGVCATCTRSDDKERRARPVLDALADAEGLGKASLVIVLGRIGGDAALEAVQASLVEGGSVATAAADALAAWPDARAAEGLLAIATGTRDSVERTAAFTGFVRTSAMAGARSPVETAALYRAAFEIADSVELRRKALSGVANVAHPDALALAEAWLGDDSLRRDAALAMIAIARGTGDAGLEAALAAVDRATRACRDDERVHKAAAAAIDHLERNAGYVTAWRLAGPYQKNGVGGGGVLAVPFPPEPGGPGGDIAWQSIPARARIDPGYVDFTKMVGGNDCCAYLETEITSEKSQPARLELGSDDGIKVWLNGAVVHENNAMRGMALGSDVVEVQLNAGVNRLLMKISQGGGGWSAACRLRAADGRRLSGVKVGVPR